MEHEKTRKLMILKKVIILTIGAILAGIGLEIFLIPNNVIDGGITGISIILGYITKLPISLYILLLNLPFLIIGYKQIGKTFAVSTLYAVIILSITVFFLHPIPGLTKDIFLASIFGGIILGVGVGLIIRHGGSLDGTEMIAILIDKRTGFSVGEIIMFINFFILTSSGFVFGWDRAMYSLVTYFIAFKVIDTTIEGLDESKAVTIISDYSEEIGDAIRARLGRGVTFIDAKGGYSKKPRVMIYSVISRLEVSKIKSIINGLDKKAFISFTDVYEVTGGKSGKKAIH